MADDVEIGSRRPRADSLRNRERLIAAAKAAFTEIGADAPLDAIARRAGVGIGTLYRRFPDRAALLAAVYRREVEQLTSSAERLLAEKAPAAALEAWLNQLVDYMATKRVVAPALQAAPGGGSQLTATGPALYDALAKLTRSAIERGEIRSDVEPDDVFRLMAGVSFGYERPDWEASARRLISVLMAGLRT